MGGSDYVIVKNTLVRYKGSYPFVDIPDGVVVIGKQAFYYQDIQTVSMPETVTVIDDEAFSNCHELYEIDLSSNVSRIGYRAFEKCGSLEELDLPEKLTEIRGGAFTGCWNLKKIKIPDAVTRIGSRAFCNTGIEDLRIPEGITYIDSDTFASCRELKKVILPDSLKSIGPRAFENCRELAEINFPSALDEIGQDAFKGCMKIAGPTRKTQVTDPCEKDFVIINGVLSYYSGDDRVVRIPDGVKTINDGAFQKNRRISNVILPDSLTCIGSVAFHECYNLRKINISSKVSDISSNAFLDCRKLIDENGFIIFNKKLFGYYGNAPKVIVPDGVEIIGSCAFISLDNKRVEEIVLPETVDFIEERAFSYCQNLRNVKMPKTMKRIERDAFSYCEKLESIQIPEGIDTLPWDIFWGCNALTELVMPKSLKKMEYKAVTDCRLLKRVVLPEGLEEIGGGQFSDCSNMHEITIPKTVTVFDECDLKGVQLNINKLGRCFKIIPCHKWGGRDEKLLWGMLNDPSLETFNLIKTAAYKVALAERLFPEYEEYGSYLKRNIFKAIKDAVEFDDEELLESLRQTGFVDPHRFDEELVQIRADKNSRIDEELKHAETAIHNDNVISISYLKQVETDLERMSKYRDTSNLLRQCSNRIKELELEHTERLYKEACKSMDSYGGMSWISLNPAIEKFREISGYKDADELLLECQRRLDVTRNKNVEEAYQKALALFNSYDGSNRAILEDSIDIFERLSGYKDSEEKLGYYYRQFWDFDI